MDIEHAGLPRGGAGAGNASSRHRTGILIAVEGVDGAGKRSATAVVAAVLHARGYSVALVREPGSTEVGDQIRTLLVSPVARTPVTELLLFAAARAQVVETVIRPALARGDAVVCDRFVDSTYAYQVHGLGIPETDADVVTNLATRGLLPDLTILLDVDPLVAQGRQQKRGAQDAIEQRGVDFAMRVRGGYQARLRTDPSRFLLIDASQSEQAVLNAIETGVGDWLRAVAPHLQEQSCCI